MRTRESALAAVASALTESGVRRTEVRAGEKRLQVPSGRHRGILGKLGICNKKTDIFRCPFWWSLLKVKRTHTIKMLSTSRLLN